MDEPLSNLDAKLRVQMRSELIKLHKKIGGIIIYVTHDQTEAMTMADRIVVMRGGYIQQIGTPKEIYNNPVNKFVAGFMGNPTMNFLDATFFKDTITFEGKDIKLKKSYEIENENFYNLLITDVNKKLAKLNLMKNNYSSMNENGDEKQEIEFDAVKEEYENKVKEYENNITSPHEIIFGIRPEDIHLCDKDDKDGYVAHVEVVELLGKEQIVHTVVGNQKVDLVVSSKIDINIGDVVNIKFDVESVHMFDKETEKAII